MHNFPDERYVCVCGGGGGGGTITVYFFLFFTNVFKLFALLEVVYFEAIIGLFL